MGGISGRGGWTGLWVAGALLLSRVAHAEESCAEMFSRVQDLRKEGKNRQARPLLQACSRSECGNYTSRRCTGWLKEDRDAAPTVVFSAKDPSGADLTAVEVSVDDERMATSLDGGPIELDRGVHEVVFRGNGDTKTLKIIVNYGEKAKIVSVVLGAATPLTTPPKSSAPNAPSIPPSRMDTGGTSPLRVAGLVAAGLGLVGLGVGTGFALSAASKNADANCDDSNVCETPQLRRDAQSAGAVATVGFIAGGTLVIGGVVMALLATGAPRSARLHVVPLVGAFGLDVTGAF